MQKFTRSKQQLHTQHQHQQFLLFFDIVVCLIELLTGIEPIYAHAPGGGVDPTIGTCQEWIHHCYIIFIGWTV
jgi:hypothetical protein